MEIFTLLETLEDMLEKNLGSGSVSNSINCCN